MIFPLSLRRIPLASALPLVLLCVARSALADNGGSATFVNTDPASAPALASSARSSGLSITAGKPSLTTLLPGVVVWEARGTADIDDAHAAMLREYVRRGGNLLLTLSRDAGTGPFRLADMLPTTAWKTRVRNREETDGALTLAETNVDLFGTTKPTGFTVPYWYEIRPVAAVERGQARYDRFERPIPYLANTKTAAAKQPAGTEFWTRSLLSHDWQIQARGSGVQASPLLLTGRYGAGRIAVFASTAELPDNDTSRAFWTPVFKWLSAAGPSTTTLIPVSLPAPTTRVDVAARKLLVTLRNPTASPLPIHLIGRILTWEHAYVKDALADAILPAGGNATIPLALPPRANMTDYQALEYRDAYTVRLGAISSDGSNLLAETTANADLRPSVSVAISTDPVRSRDYPFSGPEPFENDSMGYHPLSLPLNAYGYKPGDTAKVRVTLANGGFRNIAPLAKVTDVTDPTNGSVTALNDEASQAEKPPIRLEVTAWGSWSGKTNQENIVSFTFPLPVTVSAVTLLGADTDYRKHLRHNPPAVIVEADGKTVAQDNKIGDRFLSEFGRVRVPLSAPMTATVIRLRFPAAPSGPILGDVEIEGWDGETGSVPTAPVSGTLALSLVDALTGQRTEVGKRPVSLDAGTQQSVTLPVTLPKAATGASFLRLDATFTPSGGETNATASTPLMVVAPKQTVLPIAQLVDNQAVSVGFIVTRGFRNVFDTGTGTAEIGEGWGQPDDLVWAFAHGLKQIHTNDRTKAGRLYVSESDLRHYSTPWRAFPDGSGVFDVGVSGLIDRYKQEPTWAGAKTARLAFSDRWDTGPEMDAVYSWQDFEGFDAYLRGRGKPGLTGKTREELSREIDTKYANLWSAFHLERYIHDVRVLQKAFARENKTLVLTAQGYPLVPPRYQSELASVIRGMSDDYTWGMERDNIPLTTGRQMGVLAYSPGLQLSTLSQWGYDSGILNNAIWHSPVGTTEASRRHQFDRAFRAVLRPDGTYTSQYAYGYNTNAGYAYTFNANDYAEWMHVQEKQSLLVPEAPLGAGLVIATGFHDDPNHTEFAAGGSAFSLRETLAGATVVERLQNLGVSISFSASASTLAKWPASNPPLILVNAPSLTTTEAVAVKALLARGVPVIAFAGKEPLPASITNTLSGALILPLSPTTFTPSEAAAWSAKIQSVLKQSIVFPAGTTGYGFRSAGRTFVVVEDWREEGRTVTLHYRPTIAGITGVRAADTSDHRSLAVRREGSDYLVDVPLRPGDAVLVALEEIK